MLYILLVVSILIIAAIFSFRGSLRGSKSIANTPSSEAGAATSSSSKNLVNKKVSKDNFDLFVKQFGSHQSWTEKHFVAQKIIEYLSEEYWRYQDKAVKDQLMEWCLKDVTLYKDFLIESHYDLFYRDVNGEFILDESKRREVEKRLAFEDVKNHPQYFVPTLLSYFELRALFEADGNQESLKWIKEVAKEIGVRD